MLKIKKGLYYLGQVLFIVSIGLICLFKYWELTTPTPPYQLKIVLTGSMTDVMPAGSLVLIKNVAPEMIKTGDILAHQVNQAVVTHRVIEVKTSTPRQFVLKGDSNSETDKKAVLADAVLGKVVIILPKLGWIFSLFQSFSGIVAIVLTLACVWIFSYLVKIIQVEKSEDSKGRIKG